MINAALAADMPLNALSKRYGMSRHALREHRRKHLSPALVAVHVNGGAGTVIETLRDLQRRAFRLLDTAELSGNAAQAAQAIREARDTVAMIGKATGELEPRPAVADFSTDERWLRVQAAIIKTLSTYPEAALAVADALRELRERE